MRKKRGQKGIRSHCLSLAQKMMFGIIRNRGGFVAVVVVFGWGKSMSF